MIGQSTTVDRVRAGIGAALAVAFLSAVLVAAPAGALGSVRGSACRPFAVAKARVHELAAVREATLAGLVTTLQAHQDPWSLNSTQVGALQSASSSVAGIDAQVQSGCYATLAALRLAATPIVTTYRVYWLRVPQTNEIEAADRLAEARAALGTVAANLAAHVGANAKATSDLATMNQALAAGDAKLGTPPAPVSDIAAVAGLVPSADMTTDVAAMETALADLRAARASLIGARAAGLEVIADLGV